MRKLPLISIIIIISAGIGAATAQTVDGLDLQAIMSRSNEHSADAEALATEVTRRAESFRDDAEEVKQAAMEKVEGLDSANLPKGPSGAIDFDEIISSASLNAKDNRGTAPLFLVFVSLSMPEKALSRIIDETSAAGGFVVFRGFPNNSAKEFVTALSKVVDEDDKYASIGIDPRMFRAFDVKAVPTYVVVASDFSPCDGLECKTITPPYDTMSGNVSVSYALESFTENNGPGALVARSALNNLRSAR